MRDPSSVVLTPNDFHFASDSGRITSGGIYSAIGIESCFPLYSVQLVLRVFESEIGSGSPPSVGNRASVVLSPNDFHFASDSGRITSGGIYRAIGIESCFCRVSNTNESPKSSEIKKASFSWIGTILKYFPIRKTMRQPS